MISHGGGRTQRAGIVLLKAHARKRELEAMKRASSRHVKEHAIPRLKGCIDAQVMPGLYPKGH